ncbi:hypothetical protein KW805_03195 [Candidatus Pacearchaeota archaeon]|nr:hypothetical protein [Candidatus Pacearchaeota archaeon]
MADQLPPLNELVNSSQLAAGFWDSIPPAAMEKVYAIFSVAKIVLIIVGIYFLILIITKIFRLRDSHNLKMIEKNVEEINEKLSLLEKRKKPAQAK